MKNILFAVFAVVPLWGQTVLSPAPVTVLPASSYLTPNLPSAVIGLLQHYGNRLQQPGNERLNLIGTYTDSGGSSAAVVVTDITGNARMQLIGAVNKVIVSNGNQTNTNGAAASDSDKNVLESIEDDASESFFYSWSRGAGVRFLGARYRADNGTSATYNGPWYDIYEVTGKSGSGQSAAQFKKLFYVDSELRQLAQTRYQLQRNGVTVNVQTVFSGWSVVNGQAVPGTIQRFENGQQVFSLTISSGQTGPALSDSIFSTSATPQ